jgi:hypothetical protein
MIDKPGGPLRIIEIDPTELDKCTPAELRTFYAGLRYLGDGGWIARQGGPERTWAAVDLDEYASIEDFIAGCRKVHKGNAVRDAIKAEKLGYYCKFFDYRSYIPDVVAVNISMPIRGGQPMTPLYTRTVEECGGYPSRIAPERIPRQAASWTRLFGLFRKLERHKQGEVVSGEQLLAYLSLRRYGCFTFYGTFIGHADYLNDGIMYRMHLDLIRLLLQAREAASDDEPSLACLKGIRYIGYTEFYRIRPGLLRWKKRMLFEPIGFQFDYLVPGFIDHLCAAAQCDPSDFPWQRQCAQMLAESAKRCLEQDCHAEAAKAQAELAAVSRRLAPMERA